MKRVLVLIWFLGAIVSAALQYLGDPTVMRGIGPSGLLRLALFWPILTVEALGEDACAHGCSGSLLTGTADLISWLLPFPVLDTLTLLIVCAAIAWLIVRGRRHRQGRMLR